VWRRCWQGFELTTVQGVTLPWCRMINSRVPSRKRLVSSPVGPASWLRTGIRGWSRKSGWFPQSSSLLYHTETDPGLMQLPGAFESKADHPRISVFMITSSHVTKMAVAPFTPPCPKTPCYTENSRLYLIQDGSYCRSKYYFAKMGIFVLFCSCRLDLDR